MAPDIEPPELSGDFDDDGDVDGADFLAWQRAPNVGSLSDWENNFGSGAAVAGAGAVPEPATWGLLLMATVGLAFFRQREILTGFYQR